MNGLTFSVRGARTGRLLETSRVHCRVFTGSRLPYPTLPYPTLPYLTLSLPYLHYLSIPHPTRLYLILPYLTVPYPTLPHLTLANPTLPYPTLPCLPLPYPTLPCLTLPYLIPPYLTYPNLSYPSSLRPLSYSDGTSLLKSIKMRRHFLTGGGGIQFCAPKETRRPGYQSKPGTTDEEEGKKTPLVLFLCRHHTHLSRTPLRSLKRFSAPSLPT